MRRRRGIVRSSSHLRLGTRWCCLCILRLYAILIFSRVPAKQRPNSRLAVKYERADHPLPRQLRGWTMPPKRAAPEETQAETQAVVKRYRQAIDEVARRWRVAEEYVCPITAELPIDPVSR